MTMMMKSYITKPTTKKAPPTPSILSTAGNDTKVLAVMIFHVLVLAVSVKWQEYGAPVSVGTSYCGEGTFFDAEEQMCVGIKSNQEINPFNPSDVIGKSSSCNSENLRCFCEIHGFGQKGPNIVPHSDCTKYVSCFEKGSGDSKEEIIELMECEPGYAYDAVGQVCFFKESVDCAGRDESNIGVIDKERAVCLSDLSEGDPICGCATYKWNSATYVPERCYAADDVDFTCSKDRVVRSDLEIGISEGIRPGTSPPNVYSDAIYRDAPWLLSDDNPNGEYPYKFPLNNTAIVMIDFQRDFVCPGGFGETLGNDVELLRSSLQPARNILKAARSLGMPIIHTLESHKSDLSDLKDNKFNRGELPTALRIGEELDLGRILIRGSCGNNIVDMVAPEPEEYLIFKPGKTAFYNTNFDELLQSLGITHIIVAGVTTEVCVQSTVREATDRGYEPLVITDATGSYFERYHQQTIEQLVAQGALVSWAASSSALLKSLERACEPPADPRDTLVEHDDASCEHLEAKESIMNFQWR